MPTAYIIWDRAAKTIVTSGAAPLVFNASADATTHVSSSLDAKRGNQPQKTYDVLTVQVN